jgi:NAD(P)-dependent dehydrogenase (short-subunit alcohol dehydrogenase family)
LKDKNSIEQADKRFSLDSLLLPQEVLPPTLRSSQDLTSTLPQVASHSSSPLSFTRAAHSSKRKTPLLFTMSSKMMRLLPTAVVGAAAVVGALAVWRAQSSSNSAGAFTPKPGSLQGQTIVITGGTTGLGLESAKRLALGGAEIVITSRSDAKGQAATKEIIEHIVKHQQAAGAPPPVVSYRLLDLDDLAQVKEAANWKDLPKIDVLMNNAGVMLVPTQQLTVDGFERQIQSNHLGHFVLTKLLMPKLAPKARIINVSSIAHKSAGYRFGKSGLDLDYFWKGEPGYGAWKSYAQSKLANLLFTQELQRRIDAAGLDYTAITMHPGVVDTDLGRNLMGIDNFEKMKSGKGSFVQKTFACVVSNFLKTPEEGANTQIWLASGMGGRNAAATYYIDCKEKALAAFATDETAAKKLWAESEEKSGVEFTLEAVAAAELDQ